MNVAGRALAGYMLSLTVAMAAGPSLPSHVANMLPRGYRVLSSAHLFAAGANRSFYIVALGRLRERVASNPARPLLILEDTGAQGRVVGRNDTVVDRIGDGGQCDPFLDGDATIAVKSSYFTVQNGVACGAHWTDYITFRFDKTSGGFLFDNERSESWSMNRSDDPNADALVRDGPPTVVRGRPSHPVTFTAWRPSR